jgi:AcrR family transcriptional regulator
MNREDAIAKLISVFRHYGYEGATLSKISEATGLGRASLYHHFPKGKEEIAGAVLQHVSQWFVQTVFAPLQAEGDPSERIHAMCRSIREFYRSGQDACLIALLSVGEASDLFQAQLQRSLNAWISRLAAVLVEVGFSEQEARTRAEDGIAQIQGSLVLVRVLNDTTPFERTLDQMPDRLLRSCSIHS